MRRSPSLPAGLGDRPKDDLQEEKRREEEAMAKQQMQLLSKLSSCKIDLMKGRTLTLGGLRAALDEARWRSEKNKQALREAGEYGQRLLQEEASLRSALADVQRAVAEAAEAVALQRRESEMSKSFSCLSARSSNGRNSLVSSPKSDGDGLSDSDGDGQSDVSSDDSGGAPCIGFGMAAKTLKTMKTMKSRAVHVADARRSEIEHLKEKNEAMEEELEERERRLLEITAASTAGGPVGEGDASGATFAQAAEDDEQTRQQVAKLRAEVRELRAATSHAEEISERQRMQLRRELDEARLTASTMLKALDAELTAATKQNERLQKQIEEAREMQAAQTAPLYSAIEQLRSELEELRRRCAAQAVEIKAVEAEIVAVEADIAAKATISTGDVSSRGLAMQRPSLPVDVPPYTIKVNNEDAVSSAAASMDMPARTRRPSCASGGTDASELFEGGLARRLSHSSMASDATAGTSASRRQHLSSRQEQHG
eukprot:TRINITY_DN9544_c0_g1_i1.p1 TRINITY_DN9544_c0_g1~~TRINITY_DN9544_c0_g1_i1.p1  ORF type:complete len:484 (+),score=156.18 TRINITY_DN9544_c0_g1_i1:98-1549(+)